MTGRNTFEKIPFAPHVTKQGRGPKVNATAAQQWELRARSFEQTTVLLLVVKEQKTNSSLSPQCWPTRIALHAHVVGVRPVLAVEVNEGCATWATL